MKYLLVTIAAVLLFTTTQAQGKQYKIIFDIASSDTADQSGVIRQANNVLKNLPGSNVEIVFHGKAS